MIIPQTAPRARRHSSARALALLIVIAVALVTGLFGSVAPAAAEPTESPTEDGSVTLVLALGTHGAISAGTPISGTITIDNGTDQELSAARVSLDLDAAPLADDAAVTAWLESGTGTGTATTLFSAPTTAVAPQNSLDSPVLATSDLVQQLAPGVYPVTATLSAAATGDGVAHDITVRSVLTVRAAGAQVAMIVPITATPASGTLLTADELTTLTGTDGALTAQLDAVTGTLAVLAVDPAIPAAIRVLGNAAPTSAVVWLDRLETLPNETFALQFSDADAATQSHAGLPALLEPTTLDTFMNPTDFPVEAPGDASPTPTPSPTPTESAEEAEVELPDLAELTGLRGEIEGLLWPRADVTADDLATFDDYLGTSATTILPSASFAGSDASGRARVGDSAVLVSDTAVSAAMSAAAAEPDDDAREALLARANAALSFAGTPASGILIGLERDETRASDALRDVLQTGSPGPLRALQDLPPVATTLQSEPDPTRAARLSTLLADEDDLEQFATILDDPQVLLAPERLRILRLIGVPVGDEASDAAYEEHRETTATTLDSVAIQDPAPIQLISANVSLPVWIRNDLPWPVNLRLEVRPSDSRIVIEPYTDVVAQAQNNTRVLIPVESRVASGELRVRFTLSSPTGVEIGAPQTADVTVRAEWENIGLGILASAIVLLLAFGIVRTVRRRRRDRASARDASGGTAGGADAAADAHPEPTEEGDR